MLLFMENSCSIGFASLPVSPPQDLQHPASIPSHSKWLCQRVAVLPVILQNRPHQYLHHRRRNQMEHCIYL
jgi:hypothetical protein